MVLLKIYLLKSCEVELQTSLLQVPSECDGFTVYFGEGSYGKPAIVMIRSSHQDA